MFLTTSCGRKKWSTFDQLYCSKNGNGNPFWRDTQVSVTSTVNSPRGGERSTVEQEGGPVPGIDEDDLEERRGLFMTSDEVVDEDC